MLKWLDLKGAVLYTILNRMWATIAALGNIAFLIVSSPPEYQGFYYTFISLLGLHSLFELGIGFSIARFVSHEMKNLAWDENNQLSGSALSLQRVKEMGYWVATKYIYVSVVMVVGVFLVGYNLMQEGKEGVHTNWLLPWLCAVLLLPFQIYLTAFESFLEGLGRITDVYQIRNSALIISTLFGWFGFVLGISLFVPAIVLATSILFSVAIYKSKFGKNVSLLASIPKGLTVFSWSNEIWSFQWRIVVSMFAGYLTFRSFTPIVFYYHGATMSGQMGLTLAISNALGGILAAWTSSKLPLIGELTARQCFSKIIQIRTDLLAKSLIIGPIVSALGILTIWSGSLIFPQYNYRLPGELALALFLLAVTIQQVISTYVNIIRCMKIEPFLMPSIVQGIFTILMLCVLIPDYGIIGGGLSYLAGVVVVGLPAMLVLHIKSKEIVDRFVLQAKSFK
jgi:hypothetical protein